MIIHILQNTWVIPFVSDFNLLSIVFISESISDYISDFNKPIFFQYVTNTSIFIWSIKNSRAKATWMSLSYQVKLVVYIAILVFFLDSLKLCGLLKIHTLKMYLNSFPQFFFIYAYMCMLKLGYKRCRCAFFAFALILEFIPSLLTILWRDC